MLETLYHHNGVGLAAPQVGVPLRVIVSSILPRNKRILFNPKIVKNIKQLGENVEFEQCLSLLGQSGQVRRPAGVVVVARNVRGHKVRMRLTGWQARVVQHEIDHLDGVLFFSKLLEENPVTYKVEA